MVRIDPPQPLCSDSLANLTTAIPITAVSQPSMDGGASVKNLITFDEAWPILQEEAINKLVDNLQLEGPLNRQIFTSEDYMRLYTLVYNVASPNILSPEVDKLYDQYKRTLEDYIASKGKGERESLERIVEEMEQSQNYVILAIKVYGETKDQVIDAIASLIEMEGEGEGTDQALAKQVLSIFEEIGGDALKNYKKDIEEAMVEASAKFYSKKALDWMATLSYEDYMLKVEQCLEMEKSRVSEYLKLTNKNKVLEVVQHELLNVHASKIEEKRASS